MSRKNSFKIERDTRGRSIFFVESDRIAESIEYIRSSNIKNVIVNRYYGYETVNLDFLYELQDQLEGLTIIGDIYEYEALQGLHHLKVLNFPDNGKDTVDLSHHPDLEEIACTFSPRLKGLESCGKLKTLHLSSFKSPTGDMSSFPTLESLDRLMLIRPNMKSLAGIGRLTVLRDLEFFQATKLESVSDLREIRDSLEILVMESCKKIADLESLKALQNLNKLILTKCGHVETLDFIRSLKKLEFLSFWATNVLDGDISPCQGLKYVGFDDKRHYSHKAKAFVAS